MEHDAAMRRRALPKAVALVALCTLAGCTRPTPTVPAAWIPAGNEMEDVVDAETGRTVRYLTKGGSMDTIFHYHNTTWGEILGRKYVFFESSRDRPRGAGATVPGERQVMAADVETGDLYYLTTIEYGGNGGADQWFPQVTTPVQYYAFYNDKAKAVFFYDKSRTRLFAFNCLTGEKKLLRTMPAGAIPRELSHHADERGIRLIYPYLLGGKHYIEVLDLDRNFDVTGSSIVRDSPPDEAINHISIRPGDRDSFLYNRVYGSALTDRQNLVADLRTGGGDVEFSKGRIVDHPVWGRLGKSLYWDNNEGWLCRYTPDTGKEERLVKVAQIPVHNQISGDEKLWVYDTRSDEVFRGSLPGCSVPVENWRGAIWVCHLATGATEKYADILWAHPQPRHPHPQFSPDDKHISFVTGAGEKDANTRIAVMKVAPR
ncbi:MAG: hypothetical protein FGM15_11670 [Chthoniobacterales bacterium]|nr:hypothetical protein [Chthoniobacterales bacterium]